MDVRGRIWGMRMLHMERRKAKIGLWSECNPIELEGQEVQRMRIIGVVRAIIKTMSRNYS